jgi:type IV secretory pathway VirB10-like protein
MLSLLEYQLSNNFNHYNAQSEKKDFIKEARERNKTIFRQKKDQPPSDMHPTKNKAPKTNSLPKLKSLLPDSKQRRESKPFTRPVQENKPKIRQPKKYAHIRSSGYGGFSPSASTTSSKDEKKENKTALPSLRTAKPNKLPPIGEPSSRRVGRFR